MFAPNDDAFSSSKVSLDDDAVAQDVLKFHAASAEATTTISAPSSCSEKLEMANGDNSRTKCKRGSIYQTGVGNTDDDSSTIGLGLGLLGLGSSTIGPKIINPDDPIEACNGRIYVIDGVMLPNIPPSAALAGSTIVVDKDDEVESRILMTRNGDFVDPGKKQ